MEKIFKKSVYESLSLDRCFSLLNRGHSLELKQSALEKLELYILQRLRADEEELARFNENRIKFYLESYAKRRRISLVQIQSAIQFIDTFFEKATIPGSKQRRSLRLVLGLIDS